MNPKIRKLWHLLMLSAADFALLILLSSLCASQSAATHMGCSGERVAVIQQALYNKGFFGEEISGIYCTKTSAAIKKFRLDAGIEKGNEANYPTLSALGITSRTARCFSAETELLARCIQQSNCRNYAGMVVAGKEILGKTKAARTLGSFISEFYPDSINCNEPSSAAYAAALQALREQ